MSQLSLGFQALYMCSRSLNALEPAVDKDRHAQYTGNTSRERGRVRRTARRQHLSLAFIFVTVKLRIQVFLIISVYFNLRNILPKSGTFPPGHSIYIYIHTYICHLLNINDTAFCQHCLLYVFCDSQIRQRLFLHVCSINRLIYVTDRLYCAIGSELHCQPNFLNKNKQEDFKITIRCVYFHLL